MSSKAKNRYLRPILLGVVIATIISAATIFIVFSNGLYRPPEAPGQPLVIKNAQVFDGDSLLTGTPLVVIERDKITCIGGDCPEPADANIIDAKGMTLLPGLIDGYARFYAPTTENLSGSDLAGVLSFIKQRPKVRQHMIEAGITSFFSGGDIPANILVLKQQQAKGDLASPLIRCAGPDFTAPGGYPLKPLYEGNEKLEELAVEAHNNPAEAQQAAAKVLSQGCDALKIVYDDLGGTLPKLKENILKGLIQVAESKGTYAIVRCGTAEDMQTAAQAGARVIVSGPQAVIDSLTATVMAEKGVIFYPLLAHRLAAERPRMRKNLEVLLAAGVQMGVGSRPMGEDQQFGRNLHNEMIEQVAAGGKNVDVLRATTSEAARLLRLDDQRGYIREGFQADLVLVKGNPLDDIEAIRLVERVLQGGRIM